MKNPSMKNFCLGEICNNNKTKSKNTMILLMRQIAYLNLLACACACASDRTRLGEQCGAMAIRRAITNDRFEIKMFV